MTGAAVQWLRDGARHHRAGRRDRGAGRARSTPTTASTSCRRFTGLGSPHWDPYARGTIVGLTRGTGRGAPRARDARGDRLPDRRRRARDGGGLRRRARGAEGRRRRGGQRLADAVPGRRARRAGGGAGGLRDHRAGRRLPGRRGHRLWTEERRARRCGARRRATSRRCPPTSARRCSPSWHERRWTSRGGRNEPRVGTGSVAVAEELAKMKPQVYKDPRPAEYFDRFHERTRARPPGLDVRARAAGAHARTSCSSSAPAASTRTRCPRTGPVIVAPNHFSFLDHFFVAVYLRRKVHFMAKSQLFKRPMQFIYTTAACSPCGAATATRRRSRRPTRCSAAAATSWSCTARAAARARASSARRSPGIGRLALETGAPVVPTAIVGSERARNWKRLQFPKVTVQFGDPIRFEPVEEPTRAVAGAASEQSSPGSRASTARCAATAGATPSGPPAPPVAPLAPRAAAPSLRAEDQLTRACHPPDGEAPGPPDRGRHRARRRGGVLRAARGRGPPRSSFDPQAEDPFAYSDDRSWSSSAGPPPGFRTWSTPRAPTAPRTPPSGSPLPAPDRG